MFSTTLDPAARFYILAPDFNPIIEQYTRESGARGGRGHPGLPGLGISQDHDPFPMRPSGEAPGVRRPGPWRSQTAGVET